jgi:hypothetical protein
MGVAAPSRGILYQAAEKIQHPAKGAGAPPAKGCEVGLI